MADVSSQLGSTPEDSGSPAHGPRGADGAGYDEGEDLLHAFLTTLAENHTQAAVLAIGQNGALEPVPESLDLHGHRVATVPIGCSALDLVTPEYKAKVIEAWERLRLGSHSQVKVRLLEDPRFLVTLDYFDTQRAFGLYIAVGSGTGVAEDQQTLGITLPDLAPRFARELKDELALILQVDEAFTQILGWSPEEVVGKRSLEFIHPEDQELALANWTDLLTTEGPGRRVRLRHLHRDGSWVWVEVTNHNLLDDLNYGCVVAEMVDISEEMAAHEALRTREQLLDRVAESVPVGLLEVGVDARVVYTNDRFHFMIGIDRTEYVMDQLASVVEDDRKLVRDAFKTVFGSGVDAYVEVRVAQPGGRDGDIRYCSLNMRALTDKAGGVTGAIVCVENVTETVKTREDLRAQADIDSVTRCYNRTSTMSALEAMLGSDDRRGRPAVIFVDLDRFNELSDILGHAAGDEFLKVVAERLHRGVRGEDVVGRIGGDEFLVLCPGMSSPAEAMRTASRLAESLHDPVSLNGDPIPSRASIGVAWSRSPDMTVRKLVSEADAAMYASKRVGSGNPVLFTEPDPNNESTRSEGWSALSENPR
jgi:diguanylate cyclase (GGDEF)-like protein/PAS domain S-box-containing protein